MYALIVDTKLFETGIIYMHYEALLKKRVSVYNLIGIIVTETLWYDA